MTLYNFVTTWKFAAPLETIWPIMLNAEAWPSWWKGVRKVELLQQGAEDTLGALRRFTWRSQLLYNLVFDSRIVRVGLYQEIAGEVSGELEGMGVWHFSFDAPITTMQYNWNVSTTKAWMNVLAPIARPFFAWNHDVVMTWGGEGLARLLGTSLIA